MLNIIPICPALSFRAVRCGPMEAERSIRMYKSRGWFCKGVTVTEKVCGSPAMQEGEEGDVAMVHDGEGCSYNGTP